MKTSRKTIVIVLAAVIATGSLAGFASAAADRPDPITQIIQLLMGMQNTERVIATIHNYTIIDGVGSYQLTIQADKPVLLTITAFGTTLATGQTIELSRGFEGTYNGVTSFGGDKVTTVTLTTKQLRLEVGSSNAAGEIICDFDIIIQGAQGTTVTVTYSP